MSYISNGLLQELLRNGLQDRDLLSNSYSKSSHDGIVIRPEFSRTIKGTRTSSEMVLVDHKASSLLEVHAGSRGQSVSVSAKATSSVIAKNPDR